MFKVKSIFLLLAVLMLSSCGDLFMKKEEEEVNLKKFATCKMDTQAIALIMRDKIKGEIECLEDNLNLFIDIVKSDKPGYLSYKELKKYIAKNMEDIDEGTIDALGGIFDLSSLIFGDQQGFIKKQNVSKLATLLIELNEIVVDAKIYDYYASEENISFFEHNKRKSQIYGAFIKLSRIFSKAYIENDNVIDFSNFLSRFTSIGNEEIIENAKSLLFIKKAILGGEENFLTAHDLKRTMTLMPDISKVTYDFVNIPDTITEFYQDEEILKILKEDVETAKKNFFYKNQPEEPILTYDQLKKVIDNFYPELSGYMGYKTSILKAKEILLENDSEVFNAAEIVILLDSIIFDNLNRGVNFYKFYEQNQTRLDSYFEISRSFQLEYYVDLVTEQRHMNNFNRIVQDYRYYLGDKFSPTYDFIYNRNARGAFEISVYEDLVRRFFAFYGDSKPSAVGDYVLSLEQLENFMVDFSEILEGEGYIQKGRAASTAETITLMTSLFHNQSDGNGETEVPEFTEFIITMLSSLNLSTDMYKQITKFCPVDKKGSYTPKCFRENFLNILKFKKEDKTYRSFLPRLYDYVSTLTPKELDTYMMRTAKFSRTCSTFDDGEERNMAESDGIVTWAGLLAIEQSMLRFDTNRSGILEPNELERAFIVYKEAIEGLIPVEFLKRYSKDFFQYMVKYQRVPDVPDVTGIKSLWKALREGFHFVKFLFKRSSKKKSSADRMTFAAVLEIIADNSPEALENPFPCETLR